MSEHVPDDFQHVQVPHSIQKNSSHLSFPQLPLSLSEEWFVDMESLRIRDNIPLIIEQVCLNFD